MPGIIPSREHASFSTENASPPGYWSPSGSSAPVACPAGTYGSTYALNTSACSGPCQGGFYCPSASISASQIVCPVASYCPTGSSVPTICGNGTYGATTGLQTSLCSGLCTEGYWCVQGPTYFVSLPSLSSSLCCFQVSFELLNAKPNHLPYRLVLPHRGPVPHSLRARLLRKHSWAV